MHHFAFLNKHNQTCKPSNQVNKRKPFFSQIVLQEESRFILFSFCKQNLKDDIYCFLHRSHTNYENIYRIKLYKSFIMKQFQIISLSKKGQFIVQESSGNSYSYPIQGFRVNPSIEMRHHFQNFIGQTIDCTLNKNGTHIRYQNEAFLTEKLACGAMEVVAKELEESKIYSNEVKARFIKVQKAQELEKKNIVSLLENRKSILKYFPRGEVVKGKLEYFSEEIVVSIQREQELIYLPFKLKNINLMLCCLEQKEFAAFFNNNPIININLQRPIYNLVLKQFQIVAQLDHKIQLQILKNGWGIINSSALINVTPQNAEELLSTELLAKEEHKGIFSKHTEILSFIYAKNNFVGEVSDVLDGYVFEIIKKGNEEKVKIELAMVRSPVGDQLGAFNCREFARKQLIGQEVNVYLHKDTGLNITGSIVRAKDSKDVQTLMVQQGWGFVREEFVNSILCIKLNELQKRSKEKLRGLHSKDIGIYRPQDLTVPNNQKEEFYTYRRIEILKKLAENQVGVLQGHLDSVTYKVWLEDKNILLKVRLDGVLPHNINPQLEEVKVMKEQLRKLYERRMKKRSVIVSIKDYLKQSNSFSGVITFVGGISMQEILLADSYIYADKQAGGNEVYKTIENKARDGGKGIWSANLIKFQPLNQLGLLPNKFIGKFSWVQDGETVFLQPSTNYATIDKIYAELTKTKLKPANKEELVSGALYAAPYLGQLYRALILSIKGKKVKVLFIDWGNKQVIEDSQICQLPQSLKLIEKQAVKAKLYMIKPSKNEKYIERLREEFLSGDEYNFKKEAGDYLSVFRAKQNMNLWLIDNALAKGNPAMVNEEMRRRIENTSRNLAKNRQGVWEWSDEDEQSDYDQIQT